MFDMTQEILLHILDGMVLLALGATGFFVMHLARQVRNLRQGRNEMDRHLAELGDAAGRAEMALSGLRRAADDTGRRLENQVTESRELLEELRFMAEAADRIASRLEKNSTQARKALDARGGTFVETQPSPVAMSPVMASIPDDARVQAGHSHPKESLQVMEARIKARAQDYLEKLSVGLAATSSNQVEEVEDTSLQHLKSQAERELAQAMRMRRVS
ncbi:MAG TPA: hypothetical protein DCW68_03095 [Rhodospirillaceae bacterium]|nr:MAG: hypothetical protein A2018_06070 [Alphaproteobacteria bacterium GWF2_58_20]HAU29078.1 hypothetical protein [Rhodospirillaceae bacterium]